MINLACIRSKRKYSKQSKTSVPVGRGRVCPGGPCSTRCALYSHSREAENGGSSKCGTIVDSGFCVFSQVLPARARLGLFIVMNESPITPETGIDIEIKTDDPRLQELCRRYWQLNDAGAWVYTASQLAAEFQIHPSKVAATVNSYCSALNRTESCCKCGAHALVTNRARYMESRRYRQRAGQSCEKCQAAERLAKEHEDLRQAQVVADALAKDFERMRKAGMSSTRELLFTEILYLSLLRAGGSEDLSVISPLETFQTPLSPNPEYDLLILNYLDARGLICIHPTSGRGTVFIVDEELRFYRSKVHWALPLPEESSKSRFLQDLEDRLVRENASKLHAANTVPGFIQRAAERAIAEDWSVKPFRRNFEVPLSVISQVLFTTALKLPEDGLSTIPPSDEITPEPCSPATS